MGLALRVGAVGVAPLGEVHHPGEVSRALKRALKMSFVFKCELFHVLNQCLNDSFQSIQHFTRFSIYSQRGTDIS